jgi:hypothetical protein
MRTLVPWAMGLVLLLAPGISAGDSPRPLQVDDVLRLHVAGISEDIIVSEIIVTETVFHLTPDEIIRLKEAGLSDELLQFMIDTARPADDTGATAYPEEDAEYESGEQYAESSEDDSEWVSVIEDEEEVTTNVHVSLNYQYGSWWYDYYWDDYWYYDFHYYPYRVSYVFGFGGWYPGWYDYYWDGYWWFAVRPYMGYRWWYYDAYGYGYWDRYYCPCDWVYYANPRPQHELSTVKYKTNRYQNSTAVRFAYANATLKTPRFTDPVQQTRKAPLRPQEGLGGKIVAASSKEPVKDRLVIKDHRPLDVRRQGKQPERVIKAPGSDGRKDVGVRQPASDRSWGGGKTPVKKTPVRAVRQPAAGTAPRKSTAVDDSKKKSPTKARVQTPTRNESPRQSKSRAAESPPPKKTPTVTPRPAQPSPAPASPPTKARAPSPKPRQQSSPAPARPSPSSPGKSKRRG